MIHWMQGNQIIDTTIVNGLTARANWFLEDTSLQVESDLGVPSKSLRESKDLALGGCFSVESTFLITNFLGPSSESFWMYGCPIPKRPKQPRK